VGRTAVWLSAIKEREIPMRKLLFGLLVTMPIAFATQASALPGGAFRIREC
jgi:hypothetical protein